MTLKKEPKWETVKLIPSLVINITDNCNMRCVYCPPYGENLYQGKNEYDITAIKTIIALAKKNHFRTVRLTGGEPLLEPRRLQTILEESGNSFERLVLNTNGLLLNEHFLWLEKYKNNIVLKISFDSIKPDEYETLTTSKEFPKVFMNIKTAVTLGFNVEINTVLVNQSLEGIKQLLAYYAEHNVPLKFLTLSSYYGKIDKSICNFDLEGLLEYLDTISTNKKNEHLNDNRGISMLKYTINNTTMFLVDHSSRSSKTPVKTYFDDCRKICNFFPCDCGVISIFVNTDGVLSTCKGREGLGVNVFNKSETVIEDNFKLVLQLFENCIKIDLDNCGIN